MIIQPDGRIVAAGSAVNQDGNADLALARYGVDGNLDAAFASAGKAMTDLAGDFNELRGLTFTDAGLVAVGYTFTTGGTSDFVLARYTANGIADTGFGTNGIVTTDFSGGNDEARAVRSQSDGRLVVVGFASGGGGSDFAISRHAAGGGLDTSFGNGGKVTVDFSGDDAAQALAFQGNGAYVAGFAGSGGSDFAVVRITLDDQATATTVATVTATPSASPTGATVATNTPIPATATSVPATASPTVTATTVPVLTASATTTPTASSTVASSTASPTASATAVAPAAPTAAPPVNPTPTIGLPRTGDGSYPYEPSAYAWLVIVGPIAAFLIALGARSRRRP